MITRILVLGVTGGALAAQTPVVDRGPLNAAPAFQPIELAGKGFRGDTFRLGEAGQIWMIEAVRVWAVPGRGAGCSRPIGARLAAITLLGALNNPPVPGEPECACHKLLPVATMALRPDTSRAATPDAVVVDRGGLLQIDFRNVRWSVPGGMDILFTVRATGRPEDTCRTAASWTLAASPADAGYRLFNFDREGVPESLRGETGGRRIDVQVWAHQVMEK